MTRPTVLLAGGGTGGHVFPAIAVARALTSLADVDVVFCGTDRGLEARVVPQHGFRLERLRVEPIKGGGPRRLVRGAGVALLAMASATRLVRALRPRAVLSVGGYAAGPVSLAAVALGVPAAVLEPNTVVGLTNRLLGPFARRAYVAWDEAAAAFRPRQVRRYGVPLREGFRPAAYVSHVPARLLVLGGSQGAAGLNERLPPTLARFAAAGRPHVIHQTGRDRASDVKRAYAAHGVKDVEVVEFVEDVASALADADLVIARAGAVTVAEIAAIGRPAVLVPFAAAADDHQTRNAAALVGAGGALRLEQRYADPERLAQELRSLLADAPRRKAMADASRRVGRPNAALEIAADILGIAGIVAHAAAPPQGGELPTDHGRGPSVLARSA